MPFDANGWWTEAVNYHDKRFRSPNFYSGNKGRLAVVLHITDGTDSRGWLSKPLSKVSSHFLNRDEGVYQLVSIFDSSWANGIWEPGHAWKGVADSENPNKYTISIENEGRPKKALSAKQQQQLTALLQAIAARYPQFIPYRPGINLLRHTDISPSHRPNCPGPLFDFARIAAAANSVTSAPPVVPTPPARKYRIKPAIPGGYVQVRQGRGDGYPEASIAGLSARLRAGEIVEIDDVTSGWAHLASGLGFIEAWALEVAVGATPIALPDDLLIIGSPSVGATRLRRMVDLCASRRPEAERDAITNAISDLAAKANISDVCILSQAAKETGNFTSDRYTKSYNFAGLGATNDGAWGSTFDGVYSGLRAMIGHLLNYATTPEAMTQEQRLIASFDPRADALKKAHGFGCAPRWVDLWQKWGVIAPPKVPPPKMSKDAYGMSIVIRARSYLEATQ